MQLQSKVPLFGTNMLIKSCNNKNNKNNNNPKRHLKL